MPRRLNTGFTLIELLTVIAIIAILASMVFVVGPRMIEKAKIASFTQTCNQIRVAAVGSLQKNHDSYPAGYGFKVFTTEDTDYDPSTPPPPPIENKPYMMKLDMFRNFDMYDNFSQDTYDTDMDGALSLLEFYPVGVKSSTSTDAYDIPGPDYIYKSDPSAPTKMDSRTFADEIREAQGQKRPLVYVPINRKQYQKIADYYYKKANASSGQERRAFWYMERWDPENDFFQGNNNPPAPAKYDDYVLISVGPVANTGGLLTPSRQFLADMQSKLNESYWYNVLAIRTYWLATRDANDNGEFDFDFRSRAHGADDDPTSYGNDKDLNLNLLPDGTNGGGPLIYLPKT